MDTIGTIRSHWSWSCLCYCWSLTSPHSLLQVLSHLQRAKCAWFSPQLLRKVKLRSVAAKHRRITHGSKGLVVISQPSVTHLRVVHLCQCVIKWEAGPGLISTFTEKYSAWHRNGSDVLLWVSCCCNCSNDPMRPWLTLPCQTLARRRPQAMRHGCCLVQGTGCHGPLEHLKYPLGSWKLLGNGSLPPSCLPFFSAQSYRNSSTANEAVAAGLFLERSLFYFRTVLKAQPVILINVPEHKGLWT